MNRLSVHCNLVMIVIVCTLLLSFIACMVNGNVSMRNSPTRRAKRTAGAFAISMLRKFAVPATMTAVGYNKYQDVKEKRNKSATDTEGFIKAKTNVDGEKYQRQKSDNGTHVRRNGLADWLPKMTNTIGERYTQQKSGNGTVRRDGSANWLTSRMANSGNERYSPKSFHGSVSTRTKRGIENILLRRVGASVSILGGVTAFGAVMRHGVEAYEKDNDGNATPTDMHPLLSSNKLVSYNSPKGKDTDKKNEELQKAHEKMAKEMQAKTTTETEMDNHKPGLGWPMYKREQSTKQTIMDENGMMREKAIKRGQPAKEQKNPWNFRVSLKSGKTQKR